MHFQERPVTEHEQGQDLGEEAVLTNGENGNCDVGNNHDFVVWWSESI